MKKKLVRYQLADGSDVVMEVDDLQADSTTLASPLGDAIENAGQKLEDALSKIKPAISTVVATMSNLAADEATVEFGVKLNTSNGVIFASAGAEANFVFKLTWKRKPALPTI